MKTRLRFLISAGPTREYLDPVRFISNPSSGAMGIAVAAAARAAGHAVTLVLGPTHLRPPAHVETYNVVTAAEMHDAVLRALPACDVLVMTAAVGDYRAARRRSRKLHKRGAPLTLRLIPTSDILKDAAKRAHGQVLIGFAAETDNVCASAARKLAEKDVDLIIANEVGGADVGFGADSLRAWLLWRDGRRRALGRVKKTALARRIVTAAEELARCRRAATASA